MATGAEPGFGMWSFGQCCTCKALAARNARSEAELGQCWGKMQHLQAVRGCEAEEGARNRDTMASTRSDLEEAHKVLRMRPRRLGSFTRTAPYLPSSPGSGLLCRDAREDVAKVPRALRTSWHSGSCSG